MRGLRGTMDGEPAPELRRRCFWPLVAAIAAALAAPSSALALDLPPAGAQCDGESGEWAAKVMLLTESSTAPAGAADGVCSAAAARDVAVDLATSSTAFADPELDAYDAVVFLSNSGDVLSQPERNGLEAFIGEGKGYVGIHAAAGAEPNWDWYGDLVGARLDAVDPAKEMRVEFMDRAHPSSSGPPNPWTLTDAWPSFAEGPRGRAHVLAQLDPVPPYTAEHPAEDDHPISWCRVVAGGRSWYTGIGGTADVYADASFQNHLGGGIAYAAQAADGDCGATLSSSFQKVQLDKGLSMGEPMQLAVLPDDRVLYTNRGSGGESGSAQVRLYSPVTKSTTVAATIPVDQRNEDGLLGITLDPGFETNHWVFLYYSAHGQPLRQRISRFMLVDNQFDMSSEKVILEFPTERDLCCHSGGSMDWDSEGNLYLSTGDDTNPWESAGTSPIDERPSRHPQFDAQRTASNTNDLRGKIIRIKPLQEPGDTPGLGSTYAVPTDNLFPEFEDFEDKTRPEIYVMGLRNPFRIFVDRRTDTLFWGEVGPDTDVPVPGRGPTSHDEYNRATEAGFYGWPYCGGPNVAYNDWNFATDQSGALFPCGAAFGPVNDSPRNTGLQQLPPTKPALLWEAKTGSPVWPELGSSCCSAAFGGEIYDPAGHADSDVKFPAYYKDHWFILEWQREWIKEVSFDSDGPVTGQPLEPSPWLPDVRWWRPMDMQFGPNGNLYLLEYADGYFSGSPNAALYRIDYVGGEHAPVAHADVDRDSGPAPLTVSFSGERSTDPDDQPITYAWDFDNDGSTDATGVTVTHVYAEPGLYTAKLTVEDSTGRTAFENVQITAGNTRPAVASTLPIENGIFEFGDEVAFAFSATDAEDGEAPCSDLVVTSAILHASHTHQGQTFNHCDGTLTVGNHDEDATARFGYIVDGSYTDKGGEAAAHEPETVTVTAHDFAWDKTDVSVTVGDTVRWDNEQGTHSVVLSGEAVNQPGGPDSPQWNPPPERTFAEVGTFNFVCAVHPSMTGKVTVAETAPAAPPLLARKTITLYPKRWQAEHYEASHGAQEVESPSAAGQKRMGAINDGDSIEYGQRDLKDIASVSFRVASGGAGGRIRMRAGSPTGPVVASVNVVPPTGENTYAIVSTPVTDPGGSNKLFLVFTNGTAPDDAPLMDLDWFEFKGKGVAVNGRPYDATATATPSAGPLPLAITFEAAATDPDGDELTFTWDFGDGRAGTGQTVTHTYELSGQRLAKVTISDGQREVTASVQVNPFAPGACLRTESGFCVLDLGGQYTNDGISDDADPTDGDFLGTGFRATFAGETLPAAGPFTATGIPFEFPPHGPGDRNSIEAKGQLLPLPGSRFDELKLLAVSSNFGPASGSATIHYADGTAEAKPLNLSGWLGNDPPPQFGETVAIVSDHIHLSTGDYPIQSRILVQRLTLDAEREVESITLPDVPSIRLFAISLKLRPDCTISGTEDGETLTGTDGDDVLCGNGGDDVIDGLGGNDAIYGGAGDDRIAGGPGDDRIAGGDGDDRISGGEGDDTCDGAAGSDTAAGCEQESSTSGLRVSPGSASTYTDETYEVKASFTGDDLPPAEGTGVRFEVYRGTELITSELATTGVDGTAAFGYTNAQPGQDSIVACTGADTCDADPTRRVTATNTIIAPPALEPDYVSLFDGTSTDGWSQAGPGGFTVEGHSLVSYDGLGLYWYSGKSYENFSLKLSWKLAGETNNSGVFVRFPDPGGDPGIPINDGYEVQIYDADEGEPQKTGSIYNAQAAEKRHSNPIGHWNDYEIRVSGQQYTVILNGEVVNRFTGSRRMQGYIGIQNHDPTSHVHYRNIRIKELRSTGAPLVEAFADPQSGEAPLDVRYTAAGVDPDEGALTYDWDFGDGTATGRTVDRTLTAPGTHTATVTVTDAEGKTATDQVDVTVTEPEPQEPENEAPTVQGSADVRSGTAPLRVQFDATGHDPDGTPGQLRYLWEFGDGAAAAAQKPKHTYTEPGDYVATVIVADAAGATGVARVDVTVTDPPGNRPPVVEAGASPAAGAAPLSVLFTAVASDPDGDPLTYEWDFGDDDETGDGRRVRHTYARTGAYTATVTVGDPDGAHASATVLVTVVNRSPGMRQPFEVALAARHHASAVMRRGLRYRIRCASECRVSGELRISHATTRRLGLRDVERRGRRLGGSEVATAEAGEWTTVIIPAESALGRRLARTMRAAHMRRIAGTVITTIRTGESAEQVRAPIVLRR